MDDMISHQTKKSGLHTRLRGKPHISYYILGKLSQILQLHFDFNAIYLGPIIRTLDCQVIRIGYL